ncbi:uncharacterized protein LOC119324070 isoform X4 [Triticum dicoccoides]|uniref:uncharacterized protein LOC119324070 isoform X4 n=1 Tax=Triticum dicoccoides TaxID=85692 RepID=UPI000E79DB7A|nr:uncharacterized protein LOC119324070 isoform X4 [Triticum dicoccoides]
MQCSRRISMALQPRHENPRRIRRTTTGFVEIFPPRRVSTPTSGAWIMAPIPHPGRRPPCIPPRAPCGLLRQATGAPCAASCSPLCGCMQHAHPAPLAPCSPPSAKAASCDAMELPLLSKVHGESTFMQGQCHGRLELFRSSTSSSSVTLRSSPMEGHRRSRPSDGGGRLMVTGWRLLLCCMLGDARHAVQGSCACIPTSVISSPLVGRPWPCSSETLAMWFGARARAVQQLPSLPPAVRRPCHATQMQFCWCMCVAVKQRMDVCVYMSIDEGAKQNVRV